MMKRLRLGAAILAGAVAAGCALGSASGQPARYGGTLVVGLTAGDPGKLHPTLAAGGSSGEVQRSFCQPLYTYDAKTRVIPQLAAAMPAISQDKLTYTIPI